MKRLLSLLLALLWASCMTPAARAQNQLRLKPQTNSVSSLANSNFIPVEIPSLGTNSTQLISVSNLLESLKVLPNWTGGGSGVETNAVLTNIVATGAVTNKFNRWQFWVSPVNTNSYFAENRGLGIITNSSDFGALMQSVLNRGVDGFHFELFGNPYYNAHYVVSNSVVFTNWGTIKGDGNPSTTVRGKSGMTTAVFQLGDATHFNSGINRFEELRMEGEGTSAGSMGFHVVNSAEPVFHKLECTGFLMAGIRVSTLYNTAWAEASDCWFVQKGANSHGILFDLAPSTAINQNHFAIRNCIFGNHTSGGTAITVSNWFPGLLVENSHFRNYPAIAGGGINVYAGQSFSFVGNQFQGFGGTYGIIFADQTAATNYGSSVVGNYGHTYSAEAAQNALIYIGENVQGIFSAGNYVRGVDGPTVVDVGVTNGPRNNFDQSELRLGSLAETNTMLNVDGSGIVKPTTLSGATFSGSTLTISQQTNSSIVRQTQLTASSNALVTLSSNNVRVAAGSGVSVASAGSGGVQTFTVTATGRSGGTSNSIPVVTMITNVNIGFGSMQSLAMTTPSNQFVNFQGTETNGDTVELAVTNSAATNITITFNLDGTTSSYYDPTAGTNRSSFVVSPGGKILTFVYSTNWGAIWRLNAYIGRELELVTAKGFGVGLISSTNGDTITLTATRTNAITYAATNTTSLHIDWTGTEHVIIPNLLETNLVLIPTNMIVGRELYLTFLPGSLNYNISISNAAGTRVRWNLATNSGNAALTKTNTIQVEASLLYQTNGISAAVGRFIY